MNYTNPSIPDVLLIALVGLVTVFAVLIVLMGVIMLISRLFGENKKPKAAETPAPAPTPAPEDSDARVDSYTGVKLIGVTDKEAATLMAIIADELDIPLDELRFISIKEVK